jgi:glutamate decarboxylase
MGCYETAQFLSEEIAKMGPFEIIYGGDPNGGIPALCWKVKDGFDTRGYTMYNLADRLRSRGWQVPAYSMPSNCEELVIQRILVRHGVTNDIASILLEDMQRCLDFFAAHPVSVPLGEEEGSGYHH